MIGPVIAIGGSCDDYASLSRLGTYEVKRRISTNDL